MTINQPLIIVLFQSSEKDFVLGLVVTRRSEEVEDNGGTEAIATKASF